MVQESLICPNFIFWPNYDLILFVPYGDGMESKDMLMLDIVKVKVVSAKFTPEWELLWKLQDR